MPGRYECSGHQRVGSAEAGGNQTETSCGGVVLVFLLQLFGAPRRRIGEYSRRYKRVGRAEACVEPAFIPLCRWPHAHTPDL